MTPSENAPEDAATAPGSRRSALHPALLAGAGILAVHVAQTAASGLSSTFVMLEMPEVPGRIATLWSHNAAGIVSASLPFALAVVLTLWLLTPVVPRLRFVQLIPRAALATLVGMIAATVVPIVAAILRPLSGASLFGNSFPAIVVADPVWFEARSVVSGTVQGVFDQFPLVLLVVLLVWLRLRHRAGVEV